MNRSAAPIRVLIVDDQTLLRQSFRTLLELERESIDVVGTACDGIEALELVETLTRAGRAPQVVLMDVRMPRLDGVQTTARLSVRWPEVRVLILTTFDSDEYVVDGMRAGAQGYLLKDVTGKELIDAIQTVVGGDLPLQPAIEAKWKAHNGSTYSSTSGLAASGEAGVRLARSGESPVEELTEREREIVRYLAHGASNREIGEALFITEGTVKNHVSNILGKLGLRDRTQAALWAREHGVL